MLKPWSVAERRQTSIQIPKKMQISRLGTQQSQVEELVTSPEEEQQRQQQQS